MTHTATMNRIDFLPSNLIQEATSSHILAQTRWSIGNDWIVTRQIMPGSRNFDARYPTRLCYPKWIQWNNKRYNYDAQRSLARVGIDDGDENAATTTTTTATKPSVASSDVFQIKGAWGMILFYSNQNYSQTLALKISHLHPRQMIEEETAEGLRKMVRVPEGASYADLYMLPLSYQNGQGLLLDKEQLSFSALPDIQIDPKSQPPQPLQRSLVYSLCEAMDFDLYAGICVPYHDIVQSSKSALSASSSLSRMVEARIEHVRVWKKLLLRKMIKSVYYLHRCGYVHCDIKLENFLIRHSEDSTREPPRIKLCDFDTVVRPGHSSTFHDLMGTPTCYSPERLLDYQLRMEVHEKRMKETSAEMRRLKRMCTDQKDPSNMKAIANYKAALKTCRSAQSAQYLPWQMGDDIYAFGLVMMTVLTERLCDTHTFHFPNFDDVRNNVRLRLKKSSVKWMCAFPDETIDSMTQTICDMLAPDPKRRILVPRYERKVTAICSASSSSLCVVVSSASATDTATVTSSSSFATTLNRPNGQQVQQIRQTQQMQQTQQTQQTSRKRPFNCIFEENNQHNDQRDSSKNNNDKQNTTTKSRIAASIDDSHVPPPLKLRRLNLFPSLDEHIEEQRKKSVSLSLSQSQEQVQIPMSSTIQQASVKHIDDHDKEANTVHHARAAVICPPAHENTEYSQSTMPDAPSFKADDTLLWQSGQHYMIAADDEDLSKDSEH